MPEQYKEHHEFEEAREGTGPRMVSSLSPKGSMDACSRPIVVEDIKGFNEDDLHYQ